MRISFTFLFSILTTITLQAQISSNMTLLNQYHVDSLPSASGVKYNDVWGYLDCTGGEYGILGSASRVHFFDLRDPVNMVEVASFEGGFDAIWRDMKTYHDRAYSVTDGVSEGLMIFDLSGLPDTVSKTYQSSEFFSKAHNIFIDEPNGLLYAVGTDSMNGGLIILDLKTDPDNPTLVSRVNLPANPNTGTGYVHDIYVRDNIAYASHGWLGFFIWDMNDPENPVLLASEDTGGYNHSSWVSEDGSFAIYAEEVPKGKPLGVVNLENLANELISVDLTFKFPLLDNDDLNTPHNPFIRGNLLICSYYEDGLQVFDVTDPMNPSPAAHYDTYPNNTSYNGTTGNWGTYPYLPSGIILASDTKTGLYILQMDSSITIPVVEVPTPPSVAEALVEMSELCTGDSVIFTLPEGVEKYTWIKDGEEMSETSNVLVVKEAGTYQGVVTNRNCENMTNTAVVIVNEIPDVSSIPSENIQACEGEVFGYEVPSGYDTYNWTKNGESISDSSFIQIENEGVYQLMVSNNGCDAASESFAIEYSEIPSVNITPQGPTEFCQGNFLNLMATSNQDDVSWMWIADTNFFGMETQISVTASGMYQAEVTNSFGCVGSTAIEITVFEPMIPNVEMDGNTLTASESSYYQWYRNGTIIQDANNQSYTISETGDYYVGTIDANGCFGNSNTVTVDVVSTNEIESIRSFSLFPNPTQNWLNLSIESEKIDTYTLEIISTNGQVIFEKNISLQNSDQLKVDLSEYAKGVYFLKIKNTEGQIVRRFVKI